MLLTRTRTPLTRSSLPFRHRPIPAFSSHACTNFNFSSEIRRFSCFKLPHTPLNILVRGSCLG